MAKRRGRALSIDGMMAELSLIDAKRKELVASIRSAVSALVDGAPSPLSTGRRKGRPSATRKTAGVSARRGSRRKMSAAQRRAVSQRMKKYWAARRAAKK